METLDAETLTHTLDHLDRRAVAWGLPARTVVVATLIAMPTARRIEGHFLAGSGAAAPPYDFRGDPPAAKIGFNSRGGCVMTCAYG